MRVQALRDRDQACLGDLSLKVPNSGSKPSTLKTETGRLVGDMLEPWSHGSG